MNYSTTSDLKKDYMALSNFCDRTPRDDVIYGIHHFLEELPKPKTEETSAPNIEEDQNEEPQQVSEKPAETAVVNRLQIDDFTDLDEGDIHKIQTEISIFRPNPRLCFLDALPLAKSIAIVPLNFSSLKLVSCGLSTQSIRALGIALTHRKTLRYLSVEMNPINKSFNQIDEELTSRSEMIEKMHLSISIKTNEKVEEDDPKKKKKVVPKLLTNNKKVEENSEELQLINERFFTSENTSPFAPLFMTSAKYLSLRGNDLTDDDAVFIAKILQDNSELFSLNLFGNKIGDVGGVAIANALKTNQKLLSLSLAMNRITDKTVIEICNSMSSYDIYSEEEFQKARECIYKSYYGYLNISRDPTTQKLNLPQVPPNLMSEAEKKKVKSSASSSTKPTKLGVVPEVLQWDKDAKRYEEEISLMSPRKSPTTTKKPSPFSPQKKSRPTTPSKVVQTEDLRQTIAPKPIYNVPGNSLIRNINLGSNPDVTDLGANYFLSAIEYNSNICRISLSETMVTDIMFEKIVGKLLGQSEENQ
ncbi:hypothetical protein ABK040_002920 [Willaertia magna]